MAFKGSRQVLQLFAKLLKMHRIYFLFILAAFISCSGYHFKRRDNPLGSFEIYSVAIPMFLNRSAVADVGTYLNKEITLILSSYQGLKVYSGENNDADAVLVGIVLSDDHVSSVYKSEELFTDGTFKDSIKDRKPFYVPSSTSYALKLQLVLIKRPTKEERLLIESNIGPYLNAHPRIVLNETLSLTGSFTREVSPNDGPDSGGRVNFTKNRGLMDKSLQNMAKAVARSFEQEVLDAF